MYAIMRVEKRKVQALYGIEQENNRVQDKDKRKNFVASDIDWALTDKNYYFVKSDNWKKTIDKTLADNGITKYRKDAVVLLDGLYTASPDFFADKTDDEIKQYFADCLEYHSQNYGVVINAVVHLDERTPHMHVCSVPIVEQDGKYKLCAKEIMGNKAAYHNRQNEFFAQVSQKYDLERGEIKSPEHQRTHLDSLQYKNQMLQQDNAILRDELIKKSKQIKALQEYVDKLKTKIEYITEWLKAEKKIDDDIEIEMRKKRDRDISR